MSLNASRCFTHLSDLLHSLLGTKLLAESCKAVAGLLDKTKITSLKCASHPKLRTAFRIALIAAIMLAAFLNAALTILPCLLLSQSEL